MAARMYSIYKTEEEKQKKEKKYKLCPLFKKMFLALQQESAI